MNNEGYLKQIIKEAVIEALNESIIINEKDILYHKKEFDSGEINLCFVIGHSGSGKSTLTYNAAMKDQDKIDIYSLDDLWCVADNFTMSGLKDYGDLIYSFFKGTGKKYYVTHDYLKDNNISGSEYEDKMFPDFVHYAMKYAAAHKNKKFYIEGVWLFCNGDDGKPWFNPEEFKDYAFYIKGTSMIISHIRAAKRDSEDSNHRFKSFMKMITKNWKWYHIDEKRINRFRSYFKKLTSTNIMESANSSSRMNIYFVSSSGDIKTLNPRVPNNFFTKNGYEDDKTKRVCFAPSIDQCLMGLSQNLTGKEFYVYNPARKYNTYKPNTKEVPDSKITGEIWIKEPVELVCIGKIEVIKDKGLPGHKFTYGDNTAELYDWEWKWVEHDD